MRHFFGYRADGTLASVETYGPSGWPTACVNCKPGSCAVLSNPACQMPEVVHLRANRAANNPDIAGYVVYDCSCPPDANIKACDCTAPKFATSYVNGVGALVAKPDTELSCDGVVIDNRVTVHKTPGSAIAIQLIGPDVPDGATVQVWHTGPAVALENPINLTFTGGQTDVAQLIAPAQGMRAGVSVVGKYVNTKIFTLVGFATP